MNNIERTVFAIWGLALLLTLAAIGMGQGHLANVGGAIVGLGFLGQLLWMVCTC